MALVLGQTRVERSTRRRKDAVPSCWWSQSRYGPLHTSQKSPLGISACVCAWPARVAASVRASLVRGASRLGQPYRLASAHVHSQQRRCVGACVTVHRYLSCAGQRRFAGQDSLSSRPVQAHPHRYGACRNHPFSPLCSAGHLSCRREGDVHHCLLSLWWKGQMPSDRPRACCYWVLHTLFQWTYMQQFAPRCPSPFWGIELQQGGLLHACY